MALRRFAPAFIEEKAAGGCRSGSVDGSALVIDIPGFTALTESLISRGSEGAEQLSSQINSLLGGAVEIICGAGGFVGGFAGDSITGVFPGAGAEHAATVAKKIHVALRFPALSIDSGTAAKAGIAEGPVDWVIASSPGRLFYYLRGDTVHRAAIAQVSCSPGATMISREPGTERPAPASTAVDLQHAGRGFVPSRVLDLEQAGEFRTVTSVFVSPDLPQPHDLPPVFVEDTLRLAESLGGYLSGIEIKPGSACMLFVFGAPVSHEDDSGRCDQFLREIFSGSSGRIRAGVETGPVFSGIVGSESQCAYTVLGRSVNIASRLMNRTVWGRILAGPRFTQSTSLKLVRTEDMRLRGLSRDERVALLTPYGATLQGLHHHTPMVGRHAELERLAEAVGPGAGEGVVHLAGEAGSGKSRLLAELAGRCPGTRFVVMDCDSFMRRSLYPFAFMLRRVFGVSEAQDPGANRAAVEETLSGMSRKLLALGSPLAAGLASELPKCAIPLGSIIGLRWPGTMFEMLDPRGRFENIGDALGKLFRSMDLIGRHVFLIEDAQWLDGDSSGILETLIPSLGGMSSAWLLAFRPGEVSCLPGGAPRTEIVLEALDERDSARLIDLELGYPAPSGLAGFVHSQCGGNPFFIEQYCSFLREEGLTGQAGDGEPADQAGPTLPGSISSVLVARIDRLTSEVRKAVQTAAVLGREFEVPILSAMLSGNDVGGVLRDAERERIWSAASETVYIFRHAMMRDAAYSMQLHSRLKSLHLLAAGAILRVHRDSPEYFSDLAFHYEKAEDRPSATKYLRLAAAHAARSFLSGEAVDLFERLLIQMQAGPERAGALVEYCDLLYNTGMWDRAGGLLRQARLEARDGRPGLRAVIAIRLARILFETGEETEGMKLLREAASELDVEDDPSLRSQICSMEGGQLLLAGDDQGAAELFTKGLEHARASEDREQYLRAVGTLGNCYLNADDLRQAIRCYEEVSSGADELGSPRLKALAIGNMAIIYKDMRQFERAESLMREQLDLAEEMGSKLMACMALGNLGTVVASSDRFEESLECYRRAVRLASQLGTVQHEAIARSNLAEHCRPLGLVDEALENMEKAVSIVREKAMTVYLGAFLSSYAAILCDAGRLAEASEAMSEARGLLALEETVRHDEMDIVEARLVAADDPVAAVRILEDVMGRDRCSLCASDAATLRWQITGSEAHRLEAVDACRRQLEENFTPWRARLNLKKLGEDPSQPGGRTPAAGEEAG